MTHSKVNPSESADPYIGKTVRVTARKYGHGFDIGQTVFVQEKEDDDSYKCIHNVEWWLTEDEFALVEEKATPPQDLRERAKKLLIEAYKVWSAGESHLAGFDAIIEAMLQFASEVSWEKDRRIAELDKQVDVLQNIITDIKNENLVALLRRRDAVIEDRDKRIAELEAEVKRLNDMVDNLNIEQEKPFDQQHGSY